MRDELDRLLRNRREDAIISIRQAINSPGDTDQLLRGAAYKLNAAEELREAIEDLITDYFKSNSVVPH